MKSGSQIRSEWDKQSFLRPLFRTNPMTATIARRETNSLRQMISLQRHQLPSGIWLDLGCGTEPFFDRPSQSMVIAVDHSRDIIRHARSNHPDNHFVLSDTMALPFSDNSAALIVAYGLTEYMESPALWLQEMRRILCMNGLLAFTSSPICLPNRVRSVWSPVLYLRNRSMWIKNIERSGMVLEDHRELWLQDQFLVRNSRT